MPTDCGNCAQARMIVAALSRNYRSAFHWLAEARRWGGDTPFQSAALGQILLGQRHYAAALQLAEEAVRAGPNYPDALKLKGDALRKLNRLDEAVDSYRGAAEGAPRWGRLQIDWAFAEMRRGRWDDARSHLAAASTMDLTSPDRELLTTLRHIASVH
jgi:tetratricopeptide (TPR) repeat protein